MAEKQPAQFWHRRTFLIITGASRGIGKNLAIEFSRLLAPESTILLIARALPKLEETKQEILKIVPSLNVEVLSVDLSKPDNKEFEKIFASYSSQNKNYDLYFLVHNAATVSCQKPAAELNDLNSWNEYMSTNLYSVALLTSAFLKIFKKGERALLNITSLAAVKAFNGTALYCIGKATREMYFKTLVEEDPSLTILNYSPGPIKTDMLQEIAQKCWNADTKDQFSQMIDTKTYVEMKDTIKKLIEILERRAFSNGGRIDYYDR